jgi:hypothetical protein
MTRRCCVVVETLQLCLLLPPNNPFTLEKSGDVGGRKLYFIKVEFLVNARGSVCCRGVGMG